MRARDTEPPSLGRRLLVPWPVYVETDLLLRGRGFGPAATAFGRDLLAGEWTLERLTDAEFGRALDLLERYGDIGVDLPDASVMAMAERRYALIFTWDLRHSRATVPRTGRSWRLLVSEREVP